MTPWQKMLLALAWTAVVFGAAWHTKAKFDQAAQEQLLQEQVAASTKLYKELAVDAAKLEEQLSLSRTANAQINQKLEAEIAKNATYRTCLLPPGGVQLYRQVLAGHSQR